MIVEFISPVKHISRWCLDSFNRVPISKPVPGHVCFMGIFFSDEIPCCPSHAGLFSLAGYHSYWINLTKRKPCKKRISTIFFQSTNRSNSLTTWRRIGSMKWNITLTSLVCFEQPSGQCDGNHWSLHQHIFQRWVNQCKRSLHQCLLLFRKSQLSFDLFWLSIWWSFSSLAQPCPLTTPFLWLFSPSWVRPCQPSSITPWVPSVCLSCSVCLKSCFQFYHWILMYSMQMRVAYQGLIYRKVSCVLWHEHMYEMPI